MIPGLLPEAHDPGGRAFPLAPGVTGSAIFGGPLDCYRYRLERVWGRGGATCLAVMMNPSCADPMQDDATIKGLTRKVRSWDLPPYMLRGREWWRSNERFSRLIICNTFAYRAKDQARLAEVPDPVGPDNDRHIMEAAAEADLILVAYGKPRITALRERGPAVARMLREAGRALYVLRLSGDGTPQHPLYTPDNQMPVSWPE